MSSCETPPIRTRIDRYLYGLFSRHAEHPRHALDRDRYRATTLSVDFETYLSRLYALSWCVGLSVGFAIIFAGAFLSASMFSTTSDILAGILPGNGSARSMSPQRVGIVLAFAFGFLAKRGILIAGGIYLRWRVNARRVAIERSLPGAVRYLRALSDGSAGRHTMLRKAAEQDAYGEASAAFERVIETATLTGSLDTGLRSVASETPSREFLAPFLLKFREHARQGNDSLQDYLRMEARMFSHRQLRTRRRTGGISKLFAELSIVLVALPVLLVFIVTTIGHLLPGLSGSVPISDTLTVRHVLVYGCSVFVLLGGGSAASLISTLRPPGHGRRYERPTGVESLATATTNPASAAFVFAFPAVIIAWLLWVLGEPVVNVLLLGYVAYGFPVGAVAVKREQLDDAKDREVRDFIHSIAAHVSLGKPFGTAVETVAHEVGFAALESEIEDLAFRLGLTTGTAETDTRQEALDRFAMRVGTPLAEQTIGLVTGALSVGSDVETTFETLQTEVGSLYHQRKQLRSSMLVYVVIGWLIALVVVALAVVTNAYILQAFPQLLDIPQPPAVDPRMDGLDATVWQFYLVSQSIMLACGWFAGAASRGRYEALLHSAALVVICYIFFAGAGML